MLYRAGGHRAQDQLWDYVERGILVIHHHAAAEQLRMRALMRQYADTPMDLADASLVCAADALRQRLIFTLDSDFQV